MNIKKFDTLKKVYSDFEYINGLKSGDALIVQSFFYSLCCYTLNDIRWSLFHNNIEYDELVNELYIYLSTENWHKLDTFIGRNDCSLKSWMVKLSWRFFIQRHNQLIANSFNAEIETVKNLSDSEDLFSTDIAMDVNSTFERMENKRYVQVLKWMLIDGYNAEEVAQLLGTSVSNVYNIKHRAIVQFVETFNS